MEDGGALARPVGPVFPQSHQEIARAHHAELIREATQERLARIAQDGETIRPARVRATTLRAATAAVRRAVARRPAIRAAHSLP
jgi:hypothetical protein